MNRGIKYRIYFTLWRIWHSQLRYWYDRQFNGGNMYHHSRPWWHMCCNGDSGGWRTDVCNHLEHTWRAIEAKEWEHEYYEESDSNSNL